MLIAFTLALALLLVGLFSAVVDLSVLYTQSTRVQAAAQAGAISGADAVSAYSLYHCLAPSLRSGSGCGSNQQSSGADYDFRAACTLAVSRSLEARPSTATDTVDCTALSDTRIQAHVERVVVLPLGLFARRVTVAADFRAAVVVR